MISASGSTTPTSSRSGYTKLPPIITTAADREFLQGLNQYIKQEMGKIDQDDDEQRYLIYKGSFDKVVEQVKAYLPLLTEIKKEYEDTIEKIRKNQREAVFLQEKLKAMASEPSTIRNYRKRVDELEERILIVHKDNERLEKELAELRALRAEKEKKEDPKEIPRRRLKKDSRRIPGLSLEETTDLKVLHKKLEKLDRQLKDLNISYKTRFLPKSRKLELKECLDNKVTARDDLLLQRELYKAKRQRLKVALEAAEEYNRVKPPHQTVGDAVAYAFLHVFGAQVTERVEDGVDGLARESTPSHTGLFEEDDPNKEKEAEMMLEYIEKFNELFEDGNFEEAAIHAANSPKGILRTQATLAKFRDFKGVYTGRSPLLAFCDALMSSVKAAGSKPNEGLSADCVRCALDENKLDLLYHWLAQDRLTVSLLIGEMIEKHCMCSTPCMCNCQALAQSVFSRLRAHPQVVGCLLRQGRVYAGLQYAKVKRVQSGEQLVAMLAGWPSLKLAQALVEDDPHSPPLLPFGTVCQVLKESKNIHLLAELIQKLRQGSVKDGSKYSYTLRSAVLQDKTTSLDRWHAIINYLYESEYSEAGLQLTAMVTVVDALHKAINKVSSTSLM